jgi:hypothetical protein
MLQANHLILNQPNLQLWPGFKELLELFDGQKES